MDVQRDRATYPKAVSWRLPSVLTIRRHLQEVRYDYRSNNTHQHHSN